MNFGGKEDFCINCRELVNYKIIKKRRSRTVKGKKYEYDINVAYCSNCGEEMCLPGAIDYENRVFDKVYREEEGIVSIDDIKKLLLLYNIGKAPLSLALGFGEITITRYLQGQVPSNEYSDIIVSALTNPYFMIKKLDENRNRLSETTYKKTKEKARDFANSIKGISEKMIFTISYIFKSIEETTPLALQKLLYFSQGVNMVVNNSYLFPDDCEAWTHGPVYPPIYRLFKEFKYNPIDDSRFCFFSLARDGLDKSEKDVIDNVVNTFGKYSGKTLERLTHIEDPWRSARDSLDPLERCEKSIEKDSIKKYFLLVNEKYSLNNKDDMNRFIDDELKKN